MALPPFDPSWADLHIALERLWEIDARSASAFVGRHAHGHTFLELADLLGVSRTTVQNDLRFAKLWLRAQLEEPSAPDGTT